MPSLRSRVVAFLFVALLLNTAYIWAFAEPTIFYMGNVLAHLAGGLLFTVLAFWIFPRVSWGILAISAAIGVYVAVRGNTFDQRWALWAHMVVGVLFVAVAAGWTFRAWPQYRRVMAASALLLVAVPAGAYLYHRAFPNPHDRIRNPKVVPVSMEEEGGGPKSPFWPASSATNVGGTIPSNFFM